MEPKNTPETLGRSTLLSYARLPASERLAALAALAPGDRMRLEAALGLRLWAPQPGPQEVAYFSPADVTGYGGAAGGGKSSMLLGLAINEHRRSVIFRREMVQGRGLVD